MKVLKKKIHSIFDQFLLTNNSLFQKIDQLFSAEKLCFEQIYRKNLVLQDCFTNKIGVTSQIFYLFLQNSL